MSKEVGAGGRFDIFLDSVYMDKCVNICIDAFSNCTKCVAFVKIL